MVQRSGRSIDQRRFQFLKQLAAGVEPISELRQRLIGEPSLEPRNRFQRMPQGIQIPRRGNAGRGPVGDPLEIRQLLEFVPQCRSMKSVLEVGPNVCQSRVDARPIDQRLIDPAAERPATHGRDGAVQHAQE